MADGAFISRPGAISMATAEMRAGLVHEDDPQMAQWPRRPMANVLHDKHKAQPSAHTHTNKNTRDIRDIVGLEAQFVVTAKEGVFRLGLRFPVGLRRDLSKTPSGELTLRWPRRSSPPCMENLESVKSKVCKQTLFLDSTSSLRP